MKRTIGVTGGIGAGKSVVCNILSVLGYPVYDCDTRAKEIMEENPAIKEALVGRIAHDALDSSGKIDRKVVSKVVFNNPEKLHELNSIVHGAVREDIYHWLKEHTSTAFIETAILYESGIDRMVDEVWIVTAPENIRINRVCRRNNLSTEDVVRRIESQKATNSANIYSDRKVIANDNRHSLLLQINDYLK